MTALKKIQEMAEKCNGNVINTHTIEIEEGALDKLSEFLLSHSFGYPAVVVDQNTHEAVGKRISSQFSCHEVQHNYHILEANQHGQVIADEATLIQLLIEMSENTDVLIAAGAGTIHDIVRFVSFKMNKPFISVPTAASVDGFTSRGAPLIFKGVKQTIQTSAPIAVFADLAVLAEAPAEMTAAGFGDILGKYTSLLDWQISHLAGGEPYCQEAAEITKNALDACIAHVEDIGARNHAGISILMKALIESGLVMLALGYSRPASGAEHHLSHYWEMELLRENKRQLLHGSKVGVATVIMTDLYKETLEKSLPKLLSHEQKLSGILEVIPKKIERLPQLETLKALLETVGGPATHQDLGIEDELVEESIHGAHHLRQRCTGLYLMNASGGKNYINVR